MMFLVRSAFWLTVAFVALHPHDVDLGATASAVADQAMAAGQQVIAQQIAGNRCLIIAVGCPPPDGHATPRAAVAAAAPVVAASPKITTVMPVVPRPRPAWLG